MSFLNYLKSFFRPAPPAAPFVISSAPPSAPGANLPPLPPNLRQAEPPEPKNKKYFPPTYRPIENDPRIIQAQLFDPAVQHFSCGYRAGEPTFSDPEIAARWHAARQQAIDHILRCVQASLDQEHLALRGSTLLKAWFGDQARRPGDLDWVARPAQIKHDSHAGKSLVTNLIKAILNTPCQSDVTFDPSDIAQTGIWEYVRTPGVRIVLTFHSGDLPAGRVQLDIAFGEELPDEPELTEIPCFSGPPAQIYAATREMSLAWKLLWLATDFDPQCKDLYDAVLLAESIKLQPQLLEKVFSLADQKLKSPLSSTLDLSNVQYSWDEFAAEYPHIQGDAEHWRSRLLKAISQ
jgi:hypothetical protein